MDKFNHSFPDFIVGRLWLVVFMMLAANTGYGQIFFSDLEDSLQPHYWIGTQTIDSGYAFSGNHASLTKNDQPYGIGFNDHFPAAMAGKNVWIKVSGRVSSNQANAQALFVLTLMENDQLKFWHGIDLKPDLQTTGTWNAFADSVLIPSSLTKTATIKAYFWNQQPRIPVWMDDLQLGFSTIVNPTFLPEIKVDKPVNTQNNVVLFSNQYYQVLYDQHNRELSFWNQEGQQLIESVRSFSDVTVRKKQFENLAHLQFLQKKVNALETELYFKVNSRTSRIECVFRCRQNNPEIQVEVNEKYKRRQEVRRESLILTSEQPVSMVFRANRKADTADFQTEYWLDKQGVQFGSKGNGWTVYHVPLVSSLQLKTPENQLWVNLDYERDHPFFRFPLNPDSSEWKTDESASFYRRGDQRQFSFKINLLNTGKEIPRFMKNSGGFLATYIWTEHADWTNLQTHRATYFGSEKITDAKDAVGGYVKYGIPVTKSVFYANPDSIRNDEVSGGRFPGLESSIKNDPVFFDFLTQISQKGSEICLHTPEQYTTTPQMFKEALSFMQQHFTGSSWIDHGNNNGAQNNREDLVCDATLKKSKFFALKIWPEYGIHYVHNSYYEEMKGIDFWQFGRSILKPYSGFGDFWPKADYWVHHSKSASMIHWPTTSVLFVDQQGLWDYYFNKANLENFVNQWGTFINHCYPAWVDPKKGFWTYGEDSTLVAQPGFNQTLANMAELRDAGQLNVCTVKTYLDYRIASESVDYTVFPDGHILLTNQGDQDINQMAMTTLGDFVLVNGLKPAQKITRDGLVFWFDLPAGKSATIRVLTQK
ncbi:MAG: hypothetical protein WC341_01405 [Bacteroidales bacterium]